ncbi:MAG: M20/M25/M40 family metallo-hydrolase [Ignavibacteriales bacterium]|nr:M20/M25/M40 family metallo-hydrolase [Ignavibacteriales bacterium]
MRAYTNTGNLVAEEYLQLRLKKYRLETSLQTFDARGGNVIGIQHGKKRPNQKIIICAHFDSRPYTGSAPGTDDNESGTFALLEAARILSKFQTDYTIVYALWDNEEPGSNGSSYYAQQESSKKESI